MDHPYLLATFDKEPESRFYDVIVIGSGIGGLTAAVGAARQWKVALITKSVLRDTTTFLAQGGIAAALSEQDSPQLHFDDTIRAGAGLCKEEAVDILVNEGPARVHELMDGEGLSYRDAAKELRNEGHNVNSGNVWYSYRRWYEMQGLPLPNRPYSNGHRRKSA